MGHRRAGRGAAAGSQGAATQGETQTPGTGRGREGGLARSSLPPYCAELLAASLPASQLRGGPRARALLCPNHSASRVASVMTTDVSRGFVSTAGGARRGPSSR